MGKSYPLTNEWRFGKKKARKLSSQASTEQPASPKRAKKPSTRNLVDCPRCGQRQPSANDDTLSAHQWASNGQWCKGGREPSVQQRKAAKKGKRRSVRAVSGGLPTLGR